MRTRLKQALPDLQYFRAVELQVRGALHLHVIVWSPVPLDLLAIRRLAMSCGFGHSVDLAPIEPGSRRHAYYVSKYVTKAIDHRGDVPWKADVVDTDTGEIERLHTTPTYRAWSSSKHWGLTMKELKAAARAHARRATLIRQVHDGDFDHLLQADHRVPEPAPYLSG